MHSQVIAYQGFVDVDGSVTGRAGTFVGSGAPAVNAGQVSGPMSYQPGTLIELGWRFADGAGTLSVSWMYLTEMKNDAAVSLSAPFLQLGNQLQNSFLFSPVYNFPFQYSGLPNKVSTGDAFAAYGIWNAASLMGLEYTQASSNGTLTIASRSTKPRTPVPPASSAAASPGCGTNSSGPRLTSM